MTRRVATVFVALGLLLGLASAAIAQDATDGEVRIEEVDVRRHPTVNLIVSVPAAISNTQLDSAAFTVTEELSGIPAAYGTAAPETAPVKGTRGSEPSTV